MYRSGTPLVQVTNGTVIITFGNEVNALISGLTLTLTPYETTGLGVVWRCGSAPAPMGATGLMGASSGGNTAVYQAPTLPNQYLPASCRS